MEVALARARARETGLEKKRPRGGRRGNALAKTTQKLAQATARAGIGPMPFDGYARAIAHSYSSVTKQTRGAAARVGARARNERCFAPAARASATREARTGRKSERFRRRHAVRLPTHEVASTPQPSISGGKLPTVAIARGDAQLMATLERFSSSQK